MAASIRKILARAGLWQVLGLSMLVGMIPWAAAASSNGGVAPLNLTASATLSEQRPDFDRAAKARINQLSNGTLVMIYADAAEDRPNRYVYELKADMQRPARDIIVRSCDNFHAACEDPGNWTEPVNLSKTAQLSSIDSDWNGDTDGSTVRMPFYGDSGKPNIFSSGNRVVVTWVDSYCPAESGLPSPQRTVTYPERNHREVPFSCLYAAHANDQVEAASDWAVTQLTDGSRDAKQDVNRGMKNGGWAIIWQEDPRGLQPGEAEGPGDGASGAKVSPGTDIWYTYSTGSAFGAWKTPVRLTDNWTASAGKPGGGGGHGGGGGEDTIGNNLSIPAIWSDGVAKELRGVYNTQLFGGESIDVNGRGWYLQQDLDNEWQAETLDAVSAGITPFYVDIIDWGDNLEARDWNAGSQVRVETVLYQDMTSPANAMTGFEMRHLYGEGKTEMWGASGTTYSTADPDAMANPLKSGEASVYSRCARLTIQKLVGTRENPGTLAWNPELGQWTGNVEPPDFNHGVWESGEGPGGYSAEINVRGQLIYGFNWRVADLHPVDTAGDYRLTFSVDGLGPYSSGEHCDVTLNTDLSQAAIMTGSEEGGGGGGGGVPVLDIENNLSYIDVRILAGGGHGGEPGSDHGGDHKGEATVAAPGDGGGDVHDGEESPEKNLVKDAAGNLVDEADIENGPVGASRPNLGLVSNTAIVAYEETKGAGQKGTVSGKFVRYHTFPFQSPLIDASDKAGCIVSDPAENARRVRLVSQGNPGLESDLRWVIFWRQGIGGQGAPADIVMRMGSSNFIPGNLSPSVDPGCATSLFEEAILIENNAPLNVSSNTPVATAVNLFDTTGNNSLENSRAHRVLLRGDDLWVGYTYTEDDALAQSVLPRANYNYWLRHYNAANGFWNFPTNLSQIRNLNVNAKEPRLMGTPGSGPDCPDTPQLCQNSDIFFAAWGTERKNAVTGSAQDLDLFITYTHDRGEHFAPAIRLARGDNIDRQSEAQLRATPDGSQIFSVWINQDRQGASNANLTIGTLERSRTAR